MFDEGFLSVGDGHEIWYGQYGNKDGRPLIILNGGPGGSSKPKYVNHLDFTKYRIVMFDQRGCGQSKFKDLLNENYTDALVDDAHRLVEHLKIPKVILVGPSWGSTLAISFAAKYGSMVDGMLLSSIFPARNVDVDWMQKSIGLFFPEIQTWIDDLINTHDIEKRDYIRFALDKLLHGNDTERRDMAAFIDSIESNMMRVGEEISRTSPEDIEELDIISTIIYLHYVQNNFFLDDDGVFTPANLEAVRDIPTVILHGRYDLLCPYEGAYTLFKNQSNCVLEHVSDEGHAFSADSKRLINYMLVTLVEMIEKG